ncbi:MAG: TetR/AcrR family transcriptional regulator [Methanoregula sp.]|jgi:AcrR family transcriptional regulator
MMIPTFTILDRLPLLRFSSMPKVVPEYNEEARKKIIEAGLEVMCHQGYADTTMDDIAAHLGVSKGVLYLYFKNRDDLVVEIVKAAHAQIHEMAQVIFPNSAPLVAWTAIFDKNISADPEYNALFFEIAAMAVRNEKIHASYYDSVVNGIDMAAYGITFQQRDGLIRADVDPRTLAIAIIAIFSGMRSMAISGVPREVLRKHWMEIGQIILGIGDHSGC